MTLREGPAHLVRRHDYTAPAFLIDSVDLTLDLDPAKTRVLNRMRLRRNPAVPAQPLRLDGVEINLARVLLNGSGCSFRIEGAQLVLERLPEGPEPFDLELFSTCSPQKNTQLMGLYLSQGTFFTQCEAEGFRRISYFLDRPDVMARFRVTLRADRAAYPVLLSNGNLVEQGDLEGGRHYAVWDDPHPKPSYLFALVAGKLVQREQKIISRSGKAHTLQIYVRPGDLDKTEHAMNALMAAIAWDEARFGLPLDLERFMIVATSDFNMGAMENKGLNIFNTKYVLASPASATDADYANVESVVAHEYLHNWSGNRVTCRDWFQLSLKEGLTVFRDQEFSQDMAGSVSARAVKRIEDVRLLRSNQFAEDAGPMAHPVRPDQYAEINNFYTLTVYEKGAEVVRMMQTLVSDAALDPLGRAGMARGLRLYFERHDGQAVTCDDFAQAMADANPGSALAQQLDAFKRWYAQAGTPRVQACTEYDPALGHYTLSLSQHCPPTPGQPHKEPFVIPVTLGLLGPDGRALPLQLEGEGQAVADSRTLVLSEPQQRWVFTGLAGLQSAPTPSLLRGFSAPVILQGDFDAAHWLALLAHDSDPFNRWEAGQQLLLRQMLAALRQSAESDGTIPATVLDATTVQALSAVLRQPGLDPAFKELLLTLPSEAYLAEQVQQVDPPRIHAVRQAVRSQLAQALYVDWLWAYEAHHEPRAAYRPDPASSGRRALAGLALGMLCLAARSNGDTVWPGRAYQRCKDAAHMTELQQALQALLHSGHALAEPALERMHQRYRHDELVLDKWFALQASAPDQNGTVLARVKALLQHPDFKLRNPNRARSLIGTFCHANPAALHRPDGAGYAFWRERVLEIDAFNPQVAARLARALERWQPLVEPYRSAARQALADVARHPGLSPDVHEILTRALASDA
ncbi:aminopeptidase N [Serpentinimonas raichei]|uniref:Aminopeptidase N n=1 Tax=Serpentinimonas raichei TaxID=1458425 RepID=A0A060NNA0_9BURK|nr:aminopeptidase N [Serpentinimonas raichei]BAO81013.1 aminopeptidase N [Serpentinimonas raichei]